jgi:hypothetical protein
MANSWSIIIGGDPANGNVTFTPDLGGASTTPQGTIGVA